MISWTTCLSGNCFVNRVEGKYQKKRKVQLCKGELFHRPTLTRRTSNAGLMCNNQFVNLLPLWKSYEWVELAAGEPWMDFTRPAPRWTHSCFLSTQPASKAPRQPFSLPRISPVVQCTVAPGSFPRPPPGGAGSNLPLSKHDGRATRQDPL